MNFTEAELKLIHRALSNVYGFRSVGSADHMLWADARECGDLAVRIWQEALKPAGSPEAR